MTFGISTHLFHNERLAQPHLAALADRGFHVVEIFATRSHIAYDDPAAVDALGRWLDELGLSAVSMHAPICDKFSNGSWGRAYSNASAVAAHRDEAISETLLAMDAARRLGCRTLVLHLGVPVSQRPLQEDNDAGALTKSLEAISEAADKAHIRLALEVMPNALSTPDALVSIIDSLELSAGVCLDFGHAHLLGGAPEATETLSGHVVTTHVHDNRGRSDDHNVPFDGNIDWSLTLTEMWKIGYDGPLIFEVADHGDAHATLTRLVGARGRLQAILDDLARPFGFEE